MKKFLYLLLFSPLLLFADPRFPLPKTQSEIWQNDLDLRDEIKTYLPLSGGTLTGAIYFPAGSVSAPSISFDGDTNTGIYQIAADNIGFSANGLLSLRITSARILVSSGVLAGPGISFIDDDDSGIYLPSDGNVAVVTAGTSRMNFNASGITKPTQPCFLAFNSATDANVTGDATLVTVDFDTEVFDTGGNFASDTFTAPVTGKYQFNAQVRVNMDSSHDGGYISLYLVTSNRTYYYWHSIGTSSTREGISGSWLTDMDASDTAYIQVVVSGLPYGTGTKDVDVDGNGTTLLTSFSGSLIN